MSKNLTLDEIKQLKEQAIVMKEHARVSEAVRKVSSSVRRTREYVQQQIDSHNELIASYKTRIKKSNDEIAAKLKLEEERLAHYYVKQTGLSESIDVLVSGRKRDMTAFREAYQRSMTLISPKKGSPNKSATKSPSKIA
jgi:hypothetical protein